MELDEVMRTTFACREWTNEDVSDETVFEILDLARFAPNGGNRQGWHVIVLRDRELRSALVPLARKLNLTLPEDAPEMSVPS